MKKLDIFLGILLSFSIVLAGGVNAFAAEMFSGEYVDFREMNSPDGSIYFDGKIPSFGIEIKNPENKTYDISMSYSVKNSDNEVVFESQPTAFKLNEKQKLIKGFKAEHDYENGIYEITVSLTGDFETINKKQTFSVAENNDRYSESMGLSTHFGKKTFEQVQKADGIISGGGFGWIRDEIYWNEVMSTSGCSVPEYAENYVNTLLANGNKILLTLGLTHSSYDSGKFPSSDEAVAAFAEYCGFMAEHFNGRIDTFEIFNEPDLYTKENGAAVTGSDYVKLVIAAYNAIIAKQPNATVVVGALTEAIGSEAFLYEMLLVNGIKECIDVFSFHPYADSGTYADEHIYKPNRNIVANIGLVKAALENAGLNDTPIWVTEYGTSSFTGDTGYTEGEQAINLVRASVLTKTEPQVKKTFIYNLKEKGKAEDNQQYNYGITSYSGMNAKPAFLALSYMNSIIGDAQFKSIAADSSVLTRDLTSVSFKNTNSEEQVFVLWGNQTASSSVEISVVADKTDADEAVFSEKVVHSYADGMTKIYDLYGNEISLVNGKFTVGEEPVYVVCRKDDLKIEENNNTVLISGYYAEPNEKITLIVRKENSVGKKLVYIDQTTADEFGKYSFTFDIKDGDVYKLYVYNSLAKLANAFGHNNYEFDIDYFVGDTELTDITQVKTGDVVKLNITAKDLNGLYDELSAFAVVYKNDGALGNVDMSKAEWVGDEAVMSAEIEIESVADIEAFKFLLWDENLVPQFNAAELMK